MNKGLKNYFLEKTLKKNLKNQKSERKSDRVAILFHQKDYSAKELLQCFQNNFKEFKNYQLDLIAFSDQNQDKATEGLHVFSKKDFNFLSKPKSEELKSLYGQTYQLIFNLFDEDSVYLQLMNSCLKANFQVGISDFEQNQMLIRVSSKEPQEFFREASKYLKHITYGSHTI